jgi:hypothetical protein
MKPWERACRLVRLYGNIESACTHTAREFNAFDHDDATPLDRRMRSFVHLVWSMLYSRTFEGFWDGDPPDPCNRTTHCWGDCLEE